MSEAEERSADERVVEEAAGWVARLQSSDATERDRVAFERWREKAPAHAAAYEEMHSLWGELKDVPIPDGRLARLRGARRRRAGSVAAVLLAVAIAAVLHQTGMLDRWRADEYTRIGEVRTITLADGSRATLNTDTALALHFTDGERRIELLRGEAFFDVRPDPARPFIVTDGTVSATALGTQYGVRADPSESEPDVLVESGRVEVSSGADDVVVEGGHLARRGEDGRFQVEAADIANAAAWREGKLVASGRPLREVLATLERYRHGSILVLDDAAATERVSGIFDLKDTDAALASIESGLPVTISRVGVLVFVRSR